MKVLLTIGFLLIFCAPCAVSITNWTKRATIEELSDFMTELNKFRRDIAKSYKVANMNVLRYDLDLENEARKKIKSCADAKKTSNYVPYLPPNEGVWKVVAEWKLESAGELIKKADLPTLERFGLMMLMVQQLIHPRQTKIGCIELEEPCSFTMGKKTRNKFRIHKISHETVCIIGPSVSDSEEDVKKGEPGTQCESLKSNDGLCVVEGEHIDFNAEMGIGEKSGVVADDDTSTSNSVHNLLAFALIFVSFLF